MKIIADLHIHSRYSRACSQDLTLENIAKWCEIKGINIVATADFTHPAWFRDCQNQLIESEPGLYKLKSSDSPTRFLFSTEISCIYSKGGKTRRLHIVILAPSMETAGKINGALDKIGNLKSDGRPILGLDAKLLAEIVFAIDKNCLVVPAHAWTPWFAVFGSKSGFDSIEECFEELTPEIFAIETGLSSDPAMNWRLSALDKITLISNSDAHSLANLGREANVFELEKISYNEIVNAIKNRSPLQRQSVSSPRQSALLYTIEFYPEEGMYHLDGHRDCGVRLTPTETKKQKNICPICKKPLTVGVLNRVEELADRPEGFTPKNAVPFRRLVGLDKIIAEALEIKSRSSKQVQNEYKNIIKKAGNELTVLTDLSQNELKKITTPKIVEGIMRAREGKLIIEPGFDGQYGTLKIFSEKEKVKQNSLF